MPTRQQILRARALEAQCGVMAAAGQIARRREQEATAEACAELAATLRAEADALKAEPDVPPPVIPTGAE